VKEAVHYPLHDQQKQKTNKQTNLSSDMKSLVDCWTQCIEKKVVYIENKCSNFCSKNKNYWHSKTWKLFEVLLCDPSH